MSDKIKITRYVTLCFFVFFIFIFFGFAFAIYNPYFSQYVISEFSEYFRFFHNLNSIEIFIFIFLNNFSKLLFFSLLGMFLGIAPLLFLATNGFVIGVIVGSKIKLGIFYVAVALLPHGILELWATFVGCGYGFWLGEKALRKVLLGEPMRGVFRLFFSNFFTKVVPLLVIAAFVEVFITPVLIKMVQKL